MEKQPPSNPGFEPPPPYPGMGDFGFSNQDPSKFQPGPPPGQAYGYATMNLGGPSSVVMGPGVMAPGGAATSGHTTTVIIAPVAPGPVPTQLQCPHCHAHVVSEMKPVAGVLAWLVCAGCVLFGYAETHAV
jgi:LITAF-like zinc ribbon domain